MQKRRTVTKVNINILVRTVTKVNINILVRFSKLRSSSLYVATLATASREATQMTAWCNTVLLIMFINELVLFIYYENYNYNIKLIII